MSMLINNMGIMNVRWGVCGFNACLYALCDNTPNGPAGFGKSGLDQLAPSGFRFVKMIGSYLEEIKVHNLVLFNDIEVFTRSFPGYHEFKMTEYLRQIQFIDTIGATKAIGNFSLAMHPAGVVDFLKRRCAFNNAFISDRENVPSECIIGLGGAERGALYGGLTHWVYKKGEVIHSWGDTYAYRDFLSHRDFKETPGPVLFCIALGR